MVRSLGRSGHPITPLELNGRGEDVTGDGAIASPAAPQGGLAVLILPLLGTQVPKFGPSNRRRLGWKREPLAPYRPPRRLGAAKP